MEIGKREFGYFAAVSALALALTVVPQAASAATITYTLDTTGGGLCTTCGSGPFGTITLKDIGSGEVSIDEELAPNVFANTGNGTNHPDLAFQLASTSGVTVAFTSGSTGNFAVVNPSTGPFGGFDYAITCTACGSGTSAPNFSSLTFTISQTGLSTASFGSVSGLSFISDLGVWNGSKIVATGEVGASAGKWRRR